MIAFFWFCVEEYEFLHSVYLQYGRMKLTLFGCFLLFVNSWACHALPFAVPSLSLYVFYNCKVCDVVRCRMLWYSVVCLVYYSPFHFWSSWGCAMGILRGGCSMHLQVLWARLHVWALKLRVWTILAGFCLALRVGVCSRRLRHGNAAAFWVQSLLLALGFSVCIYYVGFCLYMVSVCLQCAKGSLHDAP